MALNGTGNVGQMRHVHHGVVVIRRPSVDNLFMRTSKRTSRRESLTLAFAAALLAPAAVSGQDSGSIAGTVRDSTGLILPGVTVEVRDAAGVAQVTFTGGTGEFEISGLAPGTYEVTFSLGGFDVPPQTAEVAAGAAATVDVEMSISLTERVVVVGSRAQPRSVTESPVPVDVIRTEDFARQGSTDLANQLRAVVPSFHELFTGRVDQYLRRAEPFAYVDLTAPEEGQWVAAEEAPL